MTRKIDGYNLDVLPHLQFELRQAGRIHLAERLTEIQALYRDTGVLDVEGLDEIMKTGVALELSTAVKAAIDRRIAVMVEAEPALRDVPGAPFFLESLVQDRILVREAEQLFDSEALVDAHIEYEMLAEQFAASTRRALDPDRVVAHFAELIDAELRLRLRHVAQTMETEGLARLRARLAALPSDLGERFEAESGRLPDAEVERAARRFLLAAYERTPES